MGIPGLARRCTSQPGAVMTDDRDARGATVEAVVAAAGRGPVHPMRAADAGWLSLFRRSGFRGLDLWGCRSREVVDGAPPLPCLTARLWHCW